jgi:hypothetical protein
VENNDTSIWKYLETFNPNLDIHLQYAFYYSANKDPLFDTPYDPELDEFNMPKLYTKSELLSFEPTY